MWKDSHKLLRNCHCLMKAAGQVWKESFTPHLKFPQKRTQTHISKYIKRKVPGGQGTIPLVPLPWQQWTNTPESVIKKEQERLRKKRKGGGVKSSGDLKTEKRKTPLEKHNHCFFKTKPNPAGHSHQWQCDQMTLWRIITEYYVHPRLFHFLFYYEHLGSENCYVSTYTDTPETYKNTIISNY